MKRFLTLACITVFAAAAAAFAADNYDKSAGGTGGSSGGSSMGQSSGDATGGAAMESSTATMQGGG